MNYLKYKSDYTRLNELMNPDLLQELENYTDYLKNCSESENYDNFEDFLFLPDHKSELNQFQEQVSGLSEIDYELVILVGIGGSNLGTWTIYDALFPNKEILFSETVDPYLLNDLIFELEENYSRGKKAIVIVASSSGKTTETIANFGIILEKFKKLENDWQSRTYAITKPKSKLEEYAISSGFNFLTVPELLVGRCSVFSFVGLLPLHLAGINIEKLLIGAADVNNHIFLDNDTPNDAIISAISIYSWLKQGVNIYNNFIFSAKLTTFGRWFRQLVGESLGKNGTGVTPIYSIGTTDLHSMAQLYFAGPKDKFTTFISLAEYSQDQNLPESLNLNNLVVDIEGKTISQLMDIVFNAVKKTYKNEELPFSELILSSLSEESLGSLLQFKMYEVVYLAKLLNVNPFDQPAVELYKNETRDLMAK